MAGSMNRLWLAADSSASNGLFGPVFELEAGDAGEFPDVICDEREAEKASVGGDEEIVRANHLASNLEIGADCSVVLIHRTGKILNGHELQKESQAFRITSRIWGNCDSVR